MSSDAKEPFKVVIVGGGVAGLEAAIALHELASDRVAITLLTPEPEFVYRPMTVREPFAGPLARRYALTDLLAGSGIEVVQDALERLEPDRRLVNTENGLVLPYDSILLALGAQARPRFPHAMTLDDHRLDEQLHGLIQDVEDGYIRTLAFLMPARMPWPLPLYELALMTAWRGYEMYDDISVTIVTPEAAPLAVFGDQVSRAVTTLLDERGILVISSTQAENPAPGEVTLQAHGHSLYVDRAIALPELFGPSIPGLPRHAVHGFISIDAHCAVAGLDGVFAAGDGTDFPVKFGGIAAEQADVAAEAIAALAGLPIEPRRFCPEVHGVLLGAPRPLYISARIAGTRASMSSVSNEATSAVHDKISARYLTPRLKALDEARTAK